MSNYFTVDGEVEAYPRPRFTVPIDENQDMSDSKFVTNAHLGRITFNRPIADWDSLMSKNDNGGDGDGRSTKNRWRNCFKSLFCCSRQQCKSYSLYCLLSVFPCINTLLNYNWRSDFLKDVSGGLTIGILNIPQGMAYSLLAGLPPVYGLYVGFLGPLLYSIFGHCTQLSIGTFAVVSLLISGPIEHYSGKVERHYRNSMMSVNLTNTEDDMEDGIPPLEIEPRVLVAVTLTFLVGIVQLVIGLCQLGKLTSYLAPSMVSGYTSGSSYHVLSSQISSIFGVRAAKKHHGPGSLFLVYVNLFKNIRSVNLTTLLISCISIIFLIIVKYFIEPLLKKYAHFNFPIPSELIMIALGTVTSATMNLQANYNVSIVGYIASGMPQTTLPYWPVIPDLIGEAILIGFVSTFLSISLVKLFAIKHKYKINFNHEIVSFGIVNTITSFFSCSVHSGSLSRSMVLEGTKTRTPLSGIFSSVMIVFVLLFLGPYFQATPSCILSSVIVVALRNVLMQPKRLPHLWRTYKPDFALFLITFLSTIILDVTYGLVVGIVACLVLLSEKQRVIKLLELQNVPGTELYVHKHFEVMTSTQMNKTQFDCLLSSIKSIRVVGSLNFSSFEKFTTGIHAIVNRITAEQCEQVNKLNSPKHSEDSIPWNNTEVSFFENKETGEEYVKCRQLCDNDSHHFSKFAFPDSVGKKNKADSLDEEKSLHFLLLDISGITHIDATGANALTEIQKNLFKKKCVLILCGDPTPFKCLSTADWQTYPGVKPIYPTLYDAGAVCVQVLCQSESESAETEEAEKQCDTDS